MCVEAACRHYGAHAVEAVQRGDGEWYVVTLGEGERAPPADKQLAALARRIKCLRKCANLRRVYIGRGFATCKLSQGQECLNLNKIMI